MEKFPTHTWLKKRLSRCCILHCISPKNLINVSSLLGERIVRASFSCVFSLMDLLSNAYSTPSDEDEVEKLAISSSRKRPRSQISPQQNKPCSNPQNPLSIRPQEAPIAGRYVSKRERAISAANPVRVPDPIPPSTSISSPGSLLVLIPPIYIYTCVCVWNFTDNPLFFMLLFI